ncbi:hypothetical protein KEM60_00613 [Austwickia sp. TVS 96-490-7B]|nr:hypothetical protein [Austwickia sp. TVS 96-490-7B]
MSSLLSPLLRSIGAMDQDILDLYKERGLWPFRSSWTPVLLTLADQPATITALADAHGVGHASMSQRIAAMAKENLVDYARGADARSRVISLTDAGREAMSVARAEWDATEAAISRLDAETGGLLIEAGRRLHAALDERAFGDRIRDELPEVRRSHL